MSGASGGPGAATGRHSQSGPGWLGVVRRIHLWGSLPLAAIILFYACTGLLANRAALFVGEDTARPGEVRIPEAVGLDRASLVAWLSGRLPAGAVPRQGEALQLAFSAPDRDWEVSVDPERRIARIAEWRPLPDGVATDAASLAGFATARAGGAPAPSGQEDDGTVWRLELESVWGARLVTVDRLRRRWRMESTPAPLVEALTALHRGRHAGPLQRLLADGAALALAGLVLSGVALALGTVLRRRRRVALALLGGSLLAAVVLLSYR